MGFSELLTLIFIVLKLCDVINWSWWLVLLPEIIAFGLYMIVFIIGILSNVRISKRINKHFNHLDF